MRTPGSPAVIGPYSVEEIEARLKTGELSTGALATADTGGESEKVAQSAAGGWLCVHQLPGIGGNPPMPELHDRKWATSPAGSPKSGSQHAPNEPLCQKCAARAAPGETLCRKCAKQAASTKKRAKAPHPLFVLFIQVPGGFLIHLVSFIFLCAVFGGGFKSRGPIVLVAVIHSVAWIAIATRLIRKPAEQGVGFGILIGVCLTGLLTATCAISR